MKIKFAICLVAMTVLISCSLRAQTAAKMNQHAMGNSPCAWWSPVDLDTAKVLQGLEAAHFKCGAFLITDEHGPNSYAKFRQLLKASAGSGIDFWAVILPPSEGAGSYPYRDDYVGWSKELAKLSLQYQNFKGFNIDDTDLRESKGKFTHNYLCDVYQVKKSINPDFAFIPTIYDLGKEDADRLAGCVDGVWLWWVNLEKNLGLRAALTNGRYVAEGRFPVYGGIYAHATSWHKEGEPDAAMFRKILDASCKYSDGVIVWMQSLDPSDSILKETKSALYKGSSEYAGGCGRGVSKDTP